MAPFAKVNEAVVTQDSVTSSVFKFGSSFLTKHLNLCSTHMQFLSLFVFILFAACPLYRFSLSADLFNPLSVFQFYLLFTT
jgi:hypothetical protein